MIFLVSPPKMGYYHLFLDGSCTNDKYPMLNAASWGIVIDATLQQAVATAPVTGITQTIDRAELMSLVAALSWTAGTDRAWCMPLARLSVHGHCGGVQSQA